MSSRTGKQPVILISGASRGIGAAIASQAAQAGFAVLVNFASDHEGATAVVRQVTEAGGVARACQGDVSDSAICAELVTAAAQLGELTAVVNNAAITGNAPGPFIGLEESVLRRTVEVNVIGTMLLSQAALRYWRAHPGPGRSIVNISSTATKAGSPSEWVHYAATKGAIDVFTRGLATETAAEGIRVNAVAPGMTQTRLHEDAGLPDRVARLSPTIPLGRAALPAEIADAVFWLLSEKSSYVTGAVIPVSGGR
ncbi:short chain dehydrogenase [Renibacterium salmoninarum ATCC 33209]|uniref:Short chain dehydrogenase n=1 Tax=Renibacterium salmoninarum (strain ATCC 33209 / DSM 20767 / JCM 11484 / NBRC 15589 / NCIMB 2235) TaxID=288705 RepID=A9WS72_RENSM|nr:SDR family oxidoreductase [Renibacterium salmoninarum]ABY24201.1 short chain dehydrogenase [Renibacterium salmoninarum ATCC 33209]